MLIFRRNQTSKLKRAVEIATKDFETKFGPLEKTMEDMRLNAESRENEISRFIDSLQQLLPIMEEYKGNRLSPELFNGVKNALDDITKRLETMAQVLDESITVSEKSKEMLEYLQNLIHKHQIDDEILGPRRWIELLGGLEKTFASQDQLTASAENTKKTIRLLAAGVEAKRQLLLLANRAV